jgi:pyridoxal phosphate-dependent aminotransferase EpsN
VKERILLSPPFLTGEERVFLEQALDSNWIAPLGPEVEAFEREIALAVGTEYALATVSGTAAIHLALRALGVTAGDIVLCSSFTFVGSVAPVRYLGAKPWFIDSDQRSWNMDPFHLEEAIERATAIGRPPAAVIAVDLYGQCADYGQIEPICADAGIPLIEDAAEALGAEYGARPAGGLGNVGVLSFNGNKIITTSGGGALLSDDADLVERAFFLANQARDPAPHYEHSTLGYNYRLSNLLAAVGRGQLATLTERVQARRRVIETYQLLLADVPGISFMPEASYGRSNRWLTTLTIEESEFGASRDDVIRVLGRAGVEARPVWKPMHLQPVFAGSPVFGGAVSESLFAAGLCLPSGTGLRSDQQEHICELIRSARQL